MYFKYFNIEDPHRELFPGPLQGRENILKEGDPDRLQDGIHRKSANDLVPLLVLALLVFLNNKLRLVRSVEEQYTLLSNLGQWINWGLGFMGI